MEPSSTNSSARTYVESHEMTAVASSPSPPTTRPEQATGRTRVRFNSSAAEIPPPPARLSLSLSRSRSHNHMAERAPSNSNSNSSSSSDPHAAGAEELLHAHNEGLGDDADAHASKFTAMPLAEVDADQDYAVTGNAQGGIFYQLLQAYKTPVAAPAACDTPSEASRPGSSSGAVTPSRRKNKWYDVEKGEAAQSQETLATLIGASAKLANPTDKKDPVRPPYHKRTASGGVLAKVWKAKEDKDARIKIHVANILKRQQYIIRMCRALMLFGAPTHRLEEYLAATAKVLEINSQFLYIPGCMIISFDDVLTQ
jgi:hypothetical protein